MGVSDGSGWCRLAWTLMLLGLAVTALVCLGFALGWWVGGGG
jgi:hypothetical protein